MNKKYEYSGGKTGIGPFALNNKNHVLTQLANLKFSDISLLQRLGFVGLDGIKSRNEIVYQRDKKGNILLDEQGNPIKIQEEGLRILDWISAMINAHVDVAKDPYVIRLNVRQYTYNICNFLLRVGYGKDTFYFLPQQILKDMASAYDRASGIYGVDDSKSKTAIVKDEITTIRKSYYDKYKKAATELGIKKLDLEMSKTGDIVMQKLDSEGRSIGLYSIEDFATDITDRDFLIQQLQLSQKDNLTNEEAYNYYKNQILISELFIQLNDLAQDMSKLVQLSQVDTKRFGGNFIEQDRFLYRLKSLIANSILFNKDDILNYLNSTFLMTKINNGIVGPSDMFSNIMIRGKRDFKSAISQVLTMINRIDTNDESLNKTISNELEGSLRYSFLNQEGVDLYDMFYGTDTMAKRLSKIKADILAGKYPEMLTQDGKIGNQLLNYLGTLTKMSTDKYNAPDIIIKNRISDDDKYLKQNLNQYWEELLESDYPEIKQFAQDLIRYQLATTAGNFTKNGIFNLLPISAIQSTGYADYMRSVTERFNVTDLDFDNFFLNNWTNNKIVKPVQLYKKVFSSETDKVEDQLQFPVLFSENKNHSGSKYPVMMIPNYRPVGRNESKQNVYTPYVKVKLAYDNNPANTILYKYIGNIFDDKDQERPVYVMTNKKGLNQEGRVVKEYDNYSNSMFEFNNIDGALDAKSAFSVNDIKNIINLGNKMNRSKWINIINNIELVRDYKPVTVALNTSIEELQSAPTRNHASTAPTSIALETVEYKPSTVNIIGDHITFRNGKVVNTPFKLNQQQEHALLVLEDFINNPNKYDNSVTLSGYAGTGKTSIISIFNKYLNSIGIEPVFSAPTHRANAVTKMNNPESQVITLHSAFGLSPIVDLDSGNYDLKKLKTEQIRKPKIKPGQLLIIDEASMVSKGLYNFVEDFKKENNIQVIYIGDPAQLSPVSDNAISPVFQNKATNVELTKVERTGDNPILEEATNLRNGKSLSFTTKLVNGFGVEYMHDGEQPNQIIKDIVSSTEYKANPFNFRILSATNAMIPTVNDMIRKQLYGDNPNQIEVGDLLMGYDNVTMNDGEAQAEIIRNSIDYKVASVSNKTSKQIISVINGSVIAEVEGYEVTLVNAMDNETVSDKVFVLDNNTSIQNLKAIANEIESINKMISKAFMSRDFNTVRIAQKALSDIKMNTITMKDYQENGKLKIRKSIDYGYAHTIHKSQGGTYDKVMIYYDTITGAKFDTDTQQQLKYVAVSRARENVYIVTDNKLNDPVIADNEDGTLKDNPLTRTTNELIDAKQLSFNDVNTKLFNLCNKLGIKTVLVDSSQLVSETTAAQYDSDNNRILLNNNYEQLLDKLDSTLDQIISHEYIHVISAYAIDNVEDMPEQVQDAVKIIEASYQQLLNSEKQNYIEMFGKIIPNGNTYYGLTDEKEMLAELANPNFRKILRKHNLLNNLINSIKNIIVSLFKKYKISSNSTIEDNLINSLNTLIDNFDLSVYNNWNEERTYLRWYRNNIISFNFNKYVGKKVYESVTTQLKSKSADQLATITINLPIGVAEELYNTIGGKDGKNKPVNFRFENRLILPVRILSMRESDKMFDGAFSPVKSYDVTVETHPTIIPQQEYKKAGNQYKHLQYITENANISKQRTPVEEAPTNAANTDKQQQHIEEWSKKEGWSEEYFKSNVLPKMLKNNDAYQVEFKLAEDQNVKADFRGQMNFDYNDNKRSDIKSTSTIEAIMSGERTATTRYSSDGHMDYWSKVKVGDIIEYYRGNKSVKVVVTKPFTKLNVNNFMNLPKQLDINFDQSVANLAELGKQRKNECNG